MSILTHRGSSYLNTMQINRRVHRLTASLKLQEFFWSSHPFILTIGIFSLCIYSALSDPKKPIEVIKLNCDTQKITERFTSLFYDGVQSKHESVDRENLLAVEGVGEASENVNEKANTYASNVELNDVSQFLWSVIEKSVSMLSLNPTNACLHSSASDERCGEWEDDCVDCKERKTSPALQKMFIGEKRTRRRRESVLTW